MPVARIVLVITSDTPGSEANVVFQTTKVSAMDALHACVIYHTTTRITLTKRAALPCAVDTIGGHEWLNQVECEHHKLDVDLFLTSAMANV